MSQPPQPPHLDRTYATELHELYALLLRSADCALSTVQYAVAVILNRSEPPPEPIPERRQLLAQLGDETDRRCVALLGRWAPVAGDLRLVLCALKSAVDVGRIGEYAIQIAHQAEAIHRPPPVAPIPEVTELAEATSQLTERAVQALIHRDASLARALRFEDNQRDRLNKAILHRMAQIGKDHPEQLESALAWTSVSRNLERVGDHAINIAEMVVFLVEGEMVRHTKPTLDTPASGAHPMGSPEVR